MALISAFRVFLFCAAIALIDAASGVAAPRNRDSKIVVPTTWNEHELKDWATPLADLNVRPAHISVAEYLSLRVDNLKTYPVYVEGKEPPGYWEFLNRVGPQPMIEPEKLRSAADWIEAGRIVFEQMDHIHLRTLDPKFIAAARRGHGAFARPDGTASNLRWVPTRNGVALSFPNCANCHVLQLADGAEVPGAPRFARTLQRTGPPGPGIVQQVQLANRFVDGGSPIRMADEPVGIWFYRAFATPWKQDDPHLKLRSMTHPEIAAWFAAGIRGGAVPRWNGSLYYPAKVPDLIGIRDRRYIDHTGTHLNRGPADIMRYAALVSWAEATRFGPHATLAAGDQMPTVRRSDEALYALALYIQSLQPPPNPHSWNADAEAGRKLFQSAGCAGCHTPPLYTNNKLTLAAGFQAPRNLPGTLDVMRVSVGTDPGLALHTRKGTGFYKVPSLKGVWYRGHYLHDGSVASLEEMFDPDRLKDTHTPGGITPPDKPQRAIKGHEFGLNLSELERKQLIAFLRTL